ncbi:MAG: DUF3710 domain-containing protein [Nocardioidaceae bacterium]|nr:DUF3710 domain-containing protein [Nocardioidaceae bacterium]
MFGRRKRPGAVEPAVESSPGPATPATRASQRASGRGTDTGPWDSAEVDLGEATMDRVDLGGLLVAGVEGVELRLQADQETGTVTAVLLAGPDGGLELRAFAAPKSGGLWTDLRREIGAEATRLGGTVDEEEGLHGPQLRLKVPVRTPDGHQGVQASRVVAVEGPRWLLRGTFWGQAVEDDRPEAALEQALRAVVVVRGTEPMSPRQPLPLRLPPEARTVTGAEAGGDVS